MAQPCSPGCLSSRSRTSSSCWQCCAVCRFITAKAIPTAPNPVILIDLPVAVGLDMSKWWKPTVQSYLAHVSKDRLAAVVSQAVDAEQAQPLLATKKAQAAAAAEQLLEGKGWVPEIMRTQSLLVAMADEHPIGELGE